MPLRLESSISILKTTHLTLTAFPFILLLAGTVANGSDVRDANKVTEQMLETLGGEPTVVYAVITIDFQEPRFRIETTARDLHLIRVINGDKSWRLRRSGMIEAVPQELLDSESRWYEAHLYRTIHRIASRDPAISVDLDDQDRLEVFADGERILWLRLDAKGEPYAFGFYSDEVGSLSGPWHFEQDGIRHPTWVSSPDGTWRAAIKTLGVNVPLSNHMFARPESND
jgi:hypothetical protein